MADIAKVLNKVYRKLLAIFGDIKVFPWPMFILYQPQGYGMKGPDVREVLRCIKAGDILLRGYNNYLDGYFIPGFFSHAGLYEGRDMVIHAIAEGVLREDLLNFCRCDYMAVLRFKDNLIEIKDVHNALSKARKLLGKSYDFEFEHKDDEYYCTEMVAKAWEDKLEMEPKELKALGGLIKKKNFMPDQFWTSNQFDTIYFSDQVSKEFV